MYCGQMAERIKMPLGTEVGLGPGDIVLDEDPAPLKRDTAPPTFRPMSIVAKRSLISATAELLYHVLWPRVSPSQAGVRCCRLNDEHVVTASTPNDSLDTLVLCCRRSG